MIDRVPVFSFQTGINVNTIKLGTSGFSFQEWIGTFYPEGTKKEDMFMWYVKFFDTVEINSTYYRIPPEKVFASLEEKTSDSFEFIIKLNKESTHDRSNSSEAVKALHESVAPLKTRGKLKGFLAQFPYTFKNISTNRNFLRVLKEDCQSVPLFVEFRNKSWLLPAVHEYINSLGIHYCCVDEPALPGLLPQQSVTTAGVGYVRFHGRNTQTWWDSSKGDRYDYLYSENELSEWLKRIREIGNKVSKTYLFFNNCYMGNAVKNAKTMADLLKNQYNINTLLQDIPVPIM